MFTCHGSPKPQTPLQEKVVGTLPSKFWRDTYRVSLVSCLQSVFRGGVQDDFREFLGKTYVAIVQVLGVAGVTNVVDVFKETMALDVS